MQQFSILFSTLLKIHHFVLLYIPIAKSSQFNLWTSPRLTHFSNERIRKTCIKKALFGLNEDDSFPCFHSYSGWESCYVWSWLSSNFGPPTYLINEASFLLMIIHHYYLNWNKKNNNDQDTRVIMFHV